MTFVHPYLLIAMLVPFGIFAFLVLTNREGVARVFDAEVLRRLRVEGDVLPLRVRNSLLLLSVLLMVLALGRPVIEQAERTVPLKGLNAMVALDISGSMRALDFQPKNRLEAAKEVIGRFIEHRKHDRIGLVLFGSQSFTLCPLTLDHDLLQEFIRMAQIGMVEEQTAIGKAIATSINRLRSSSTHKKTTTSTTESKDSGIPDAQSKIVILVTVGVKTVSSNMDPITSA
jgi:Ca-activated chloride channel family protein